MLVRILIWSLYDSKTTIEELREVLEELEPPSVSVWNHASERFGVVVFGDELPGAVTQARELIGRDPDVAEEFDELDLWGPGVPGAPYGTKTDQVDAVRIPKERRVVAGDVFFPAARSRSSSPCSRAHPNRSSTISPRRGLEREVMEPDGIAVDLATATVCASRIPSEAPTPSPSRYQMVSPRSPTAVSAYVYPSGSSNSR